MITTDRVVPVMSVAPFAGVEETRVGAAVVLPSSGVVSSLLPHEVINAAKVAIIDRGKSLVFILFQYKKGTDGIARPLFTDCYLRIVISLMIKLDP